MQPETFDDAKEDTSHIISPLFSSSEKPLAADEIGYVKIYKMISGKNGKTTRRALNLSKLGIEINPYETQEEDIIECLEPGNYYLEPRTASHAILPGCRTLLVEEEDGGNEEDDDPQGDPEEHEMYPGRRGDDSMFARDDTTLETLRGSDGHEYFVPKNMSAEKKTDELRRQMFERKQEEETRSKIEEAKRLQSSNFREIAEFVATIDKLRGGNQNSSTQDHERANYWRSECDRKSTELEELRRRHMTEYDRLDRDWRDRCNRLEKEMQEKINDLVKENDTLKQSNILLSRDKIKAEAEVDIARKRPISEREEEGLSGLPKVIEQISQIAPAMPAIMNTLKEVMGNAAAAPGVVAGTVGG